ncbi:MAG: hypothetical protein GEU90_20555 [Gemmatimonas sp.]|nr:hypothetical protein [Gemmatimonas sp.]
MERTLRLAHDFLEETRADLERAALEGSDLPPRIRMVHERRGHASPEFRTLAVPIPEGAEGSSPIALSAAIASFARTRAPHCLLLTLDVVGAGDGGEPRSVLIAEARDRSGTRFFMVQPFVLDRGRVRWYEPFEGGWRDPGEEEMILDAAFAG